MNAFRSCYHGAGQATCSARDLYDRLGSQPSASCSNACRYYRGTLQHYLTMADAVAELLDADAESLTDQSKQSSSG